MATVAQLLGSKPKALYSVAPDAPVLEAIRLMADYGVGALLVMQGTKLEGIVSERDYARKVILKGRSSSDIETMLDGEQCGRSATQASNCCSNPASCLTGGDMSNVDGNTEQSTAGSLFRARGLLQRAM